MISNPPTIRIREMAVFTEFQPTPKSKENDKI